MVARPVDGTARALVPRPRHWGFKAPCAVLFLPLWRLFLPGFRVLHVVRDGRDMAFSSNVGDVKRLYRKLIPKSSWLGRDKAAAAECWCVANR